MISNAQKKKSKKNNVCAGRMFSFLKVHEDSGIYNKIKFVPEIQFALAADKMTYSRLARFVSTRRALTAERGVLSARRRRAENIRTCAILQPCGIMHSWPSRRGHIDFESSFCGPAG